MSFFKDLSKMISETAKEAAKKSSNLVGSTKLSMQMDKYREEIDNIFYDIGKLLYENYEQEDWVKSRFEQKMSQIRDLQENIEKLRKEIVKIKNIKVCESCEAEMDKDALFCPKCGTKSAVEEEIEEGNNEEQSKEQSEDEFKKCKVCTSYNSIDAKYCSKCGATF